MTSWVCPACSCELPARFKFCGDCGAPRTDPATESDGGEEAERRQLTILFCDLVDSTILSERLDPEDLRQVIRDYQRACSKVIERYDGHVAQYLGDGLLVYFGYPRAHEDDARRGIAAALGMIASVADLSANLTLGGGLRLAVRIGIHTGPVVAGEVGGGARRERLAIGSTPNIAARIQGMAWPNRILISNFTKHLAGDHFTTQEMGAHELKGIAEPMVLYQVLGEARTPSPSRVLASRPDALVGRATELDLMCAKWRAATAGSTKAVVLCGEAGIGKSRLLQAFRERLADEPYELVLSACSPFHEGSPFYPLVDMLHRRLEIDDTDAGRAQLLPRLETLVASLNLPVYRLVPILGGLLGVPLEAPYAAPDLAPEKLKAETKAALAQLVIGVTEQKPLLFVLEDLHWVDPSTLEFLTELLERQPAAHLLLLFTSRLNFAAPWASCDNGVELTTITLDKLTKSAALELVRDLVDGKGLPNELLNHLINQTDGNPLFLEELVRTVLESNMVRDRGGYYELTGPLPVLDIPVTLDGSLQARLDRLGASKEIAQIAATIGRDFSPELLRLVSERTEDELRPHVERLIESHLWEAVPDEISPRLRFRHAFIQQTAYNSLLRTTRRRYHTHIAEVLERDFAALADEQPAILARHHAETDHPANAIPYLQRAGGIALSRSANIEARGHFEAALKLLPAANDDTSARTELDLQLAFGATLFATEGPWSANSIAAYRRAREICLRIGDKERLAPVLVGLYIGAATRLELVEAVRLTEECLALSAKLGDATIELWAQWAIAQTRYYLADFIAARDHNDRAARLCTGDLPQTVLLRYGLDPEIQVRRLDAYLAWALGELELSGRKVQELFDHVAAQDNAVGTLIAHDVACFCAFFARDVDAVRHYAERHLDLARQHSNRMFQGNAMMLRGWAMAHDGNAAAGVLEVERGYREFVAPATGQAVHDLYSLLIAEANLLAGLHTAGLEAIQRGIDTAEAHDWASYLAEMHRLKGELLLARDPSDIGAPREQFQRACELAKRQRAKVLELRAAVSLARLEAPRPGGAAARARVAALYGELWTGYEAPDLTRARALLDDLATETPETPLSRPGTEGTSPATKITLPKRSQP